jgi:uncharacterized Zn finger protein
MQRLSQRDGGLFPKPVEIEMNCTCPDWVGMCKHVAATLYGVGARLDAMPELLFTLRDVDHLELIKQAVDVENLDQALQGGPSGALAGSNLEEIFGIELDGTAEPKKTRGRVSALASGGRKKNTSSVPRKSQHVDEAKRAGTPRSQKKVVKPRRRARV